MSTSKIGTEQGTASEFGSALSCEPASKLYDRNKQQTVLRDCLRRTMQGTEDGCCFPHKEFVLISGASGTGKTTLAHSLKQHLDSGYFVSGKYDQLKTADGYTPFGDAFTELVALSLESEDGGRFRDAIEEELGPDVELLADFLPAIRTLLVPADAPQAHDTALSGERIISGHNSLARINATRTLHDVVCKFVKAVTSKQCPLVLFIDDLQFCTDKNAFDLLNELVMRANVPGLLVVGATRMHTQLLQDMLDKEDDGDASMLLTEIQVANLPLEAVKAMIADKLAVTKERSQSLADAVTAHTGGNAMFVQQVLKFLTEDGYLSYINERKTDYTWDCEMLLEALEEKDLTQVLTEKMGKLPEDTKEVLKVAACLGAEFSSVVIYSAGLEVDVTDSLQFCVRVGFLWEKTGDRSSFQWCHDQFQRAAYSLIPPESASEFQLMIGRRLHSNLTVDELNKHILVVVDQLCHGLYSLRDEGERHVVSELCLQAGRQMSLASSFSEALSYFEMGIQLLSKRHWRDEYDLSLSLFNAAAEVAHACGDHDLVDTLVDDVLQHGRRFEDKLEAYTIKMYTNGVRRELKKAAELGLFLLDQCGAPLPRNANAFRVLKAILETKRVLRNKTDDDVCSLPRMVDEEKLRVMRIIHLVMPYLFFCKPSHSVLAGLALIRFTMKDGLSCLSPHGFSFYAMLLSNPPLDNPEEAYRYALLATRLQTQVGVREWEARTMSIVHGMVLHVKTAMRDALVPLRRSMRSSIVTGDVEYAGLTACFLVGLYFNSGLPLRDIVPELLSHVEFLHVNKQFAMKAQYTPWVQMILNFLGESEDPLILTGDVEDEASSMKKAQAEKNVPAVSLFYHLKSILSYYMGNYQIADECLRNYRQCKIKGNAPFALLTITFIESMTSTALNRNLRRAKRNVKYLRDFSLRSPPNARCKSLLVEAELASGANKFFEAAQLYEMASGAAQEHRMLNEQALVNERLSRLLTQIGKTEEGSLCMERCKELYKEWGAEVVTRRLSHSAYPTSCDSGRT